MPRTLAEGPEGEPSSPPTERRSSKRIPHPGWGAKIPAPPAGSVARTGTRRCHGPVPILCRLSRGAPAGARPGPRTRPQRGPVDDSARPPEAGKGLPAGIACAVAELLFDPEELVVLRHPVGARGGSRLDLPRARRHGEIGDGGVLRLPRAVRDDRRIAARPRELDGVERLGERPDLVDLDEDRVRDTALDPAPEPLDVRGEQVVADELDAVAEPLRQHSPVAPLVLRPAVLDRDDRVAGGQRVPEVDHPSRLELPTLAGQPVAPVAPELGRRRIDPDRHAVA